MLPVLCSASLLLALPLEDAPRPRLLVTTDIGGDPDDTQSLVRLLLYSNELELEGLIASAAGTPGELRDAVTRPDLIAQAIDAYDAVQPSLARHDPRYPPAEALRAVVATGNPSRSQAVLGVDTPGSQRIVDAADRDDPRPLHLAVWGGSTELAQAVWRIRADRGAAGVATFLAKVRVHAIAHQDDTGPWIVEQFPELTYVLSNAPEGADRREAGFRGMYLGGDESLTSRDWIEANVRVGHGPLGALYPVRTWTAPNPHGCLKEGDTPSWLGLVPNGLNDPEHPDWGGWGGRFVRGGGGLWLDAADTVGTETHVRAAVHRWRPAFQADFAARLDWCVAPPEAANHAPRVAIAGPAHKHVRAGQAVVLDAGASSDPDGDGLSFRWWQYREAGGYDGEVSVRVEEAGEAVVEAPADAAGCTVHIVCEVTDDGQPRLTRYRRVVLVLE